MVASRIRLRRSRWAAEPRSSYDNEFSVLIGSSLLSAADRRLGYPRTRLV